jgi:hypothetical protein
MRIEVTLLLFTLLAPACDGPRAVTPSPSTTSVPSPDMTPSAPLPSAQPAQNAWSWTFDADPRGAAPPGFSFGRTGEGRIGKWVVRADAGSNVLAQLDPDETDFRFPVAVANEPKLQNVRVTVRCKMVAGKVDQACGLVARYQDENNYLITRANALEGNIRLYTVRNGKRKEIADQRGPITANAWHAYRMDVVSDRIQVFWDGKAVIDQRDDAFRVAGRVGVWTKADSVSYFDDLKAEAL